jgi:hypothetical protein
LRAEFISQIGFGKDGNKLAEYDKGRFYWIKLTDRFMTSDTVDFLMSQKDGANYVVLYQMLCLKTVNHGGVLARNLGEILVPYDVEKIQRDSKWFSTDTVRIALELYKKLGLIYENQDGMLAISDFDKMVGCQSYGAEKKALQMARREAELIEGGKKGGQKVENFPPEKDIEIKILEKEKDKEIKILDKDKYILPDGNMYSASPAEPTKPSAPQKHKYGEYKNVLLTDEEYEKLQDEFPNDYEERIERLSSYIASKGAKYKNHLATIRNWARKDREKVAEDEMATTNPFLEMLDEIRGGKR